MVTEILNNQLVQVTSAATVVTVANSETIIHWYDPYWNPIWTFLPWPELATVLGVPWLVFLMYINISDRIKKRREETS